MKSEKKIQAEIVRAFSEKYPKKNGLMWHTRNVSFSAKDGMTQKALGMVPGVADLIIYENGILKAFEVKAPGSKHSKDHILQQIEWGEKIINQGGKYYFVRSVEEFFAAYDYGMGVFPDLSKSTVTF